MMPMLFRLNSAWPGLAERAVTLNRMIPRCELAGRFRIVPRVLFESLLFAVVKTQTSAHQVTAIPCTWAVAGTHVELKKIGELSASDSLPSEPTSSVCSWLPCWNESSVV